MKFDDFDRKMRVYETAADYRILPGLFMVARIDGRSFTRLTKQVAKFDVPFDARFRDMMIVTTKALIQCGFRVIYAYTESDEISLLLDPEENLFRRKLRKYNSTLAGEASAQFSVQLGVPASFDCRISQLPTKQLVVDYFRWRNEDAARNALNAWCYWTLRKRGVAQQQATNQLSGVSTSDKHDLLFEYGINFNTLPRWQKRGVGLYWEVFERTGLNPNTNEPTASRRRRIRVEDELPSKHEYGDFVAQLVENRRKQGAA